MNFEQTTKIKITIRSNHGNRVRKKHTIYSARGTNNEQGYLSTRYLI